MFQLAPQQSEELSSPIADTSLEVAQETLTNIEKINVALPQVKGLEASDQEMDELANLAASSYRDLMDLGFQIDSRYSSEIFSVASNMLGHAITAKTAKVQKKLKMIELQLKKAQLDLKQSTKEEQLDSTPIGEGKLLDRNELLKALINKNNENQ